MKKIVSLIVTLCVLLTMASALLPAGVVSADVTDWANDTYLVPTDNSDGSITWPGLAYNPTIWSTKTVTVEGAIIKAAFALPDAGSMFFMGFKGNTGTLTRGGDQTAPILAFEFLCHTSADSYLLWSRAAAGGSLVDGGHILVPTHSDMRYVSVEFSKSASAWVMTIKLYSDAYTTQIGENHQQSVPFTELAADAFADGKAYPFFHRANDPTPTDLTASVYEVQPYQVVEDMITALPAISAVTSADQAAVDAAKSAYDALDGTQKPLVSATLVTKLNDLIAKLASASALELVTAAITALPAPAAVTLANKAAIDSAKSAYDALTADQKEQVSADLVTKLEGCIARLELFDLDSAWVLDPDFGGYPGNYKKYDEPTGLNDFYSKGGNLGGRTIKEYDVDRFRATFLLKDFGVTGGQMRVGLYDATTQPNFGGTSIPTGILWEIYCIGASSSAPEENSFYTMAEYMNGGTIMESGNEGGTYSGRQQISGDINNTAFTITFYKNVDEGCWISSLLQYESLAAVDVDEPVFGHWVSIPFAAMPENAFSDNKAHIMFYGNGHDKLYNTMIGDFRLAPEYEAPSNELSSEDVEELISMLPDVEDFTLADKDDLLAAKEAYDSLTDEQKEQFPTLMLNKLEALLARLAELEAGEEGGPGDEEEKAKEVPKTGVPAAVSVTALFAVSAAMLVMHTRKKRNAQRS